MEQTKRITLTRDDEGLKQDIANGLINLRTVKGWTRKELADLLHGITTGHLQKWEAQGRAPKGMHLLRIARLLNLDLASYPVSAIRTSGVLRAQRQAQLDGESRQPIIKVDSLIAELRLQSGLHAKDFAERWGLPLQTLRNWENGVVPSGNNAVRVAEHLGLPPSAIGLI